MELKITVFKGTVIFKSGHVEKNTHYPLSHICSLYLNERCDSQLETILEEQGNRDVGDARRRKENES